jgi:hypothetical protein
VTYLRIREHVWHDREGRDEPDAHVPPEVRHEQVERVLELEKRISQLTGFTGY